LLVFASTATLALNIANPLGTGTYGKAAFDAVGPLLLIGWAEVGPGLLQAIATIGHPVTTAFDVEAPGSSDDRHDPQDPAGGAAYREVGTGSTTTTSPTSGGIDDYGIQGSAAEIFTEDDLLDRARVRTPSIGSSIVARSRQTPSAENFTSAPPARGFWWRSSEPNNPQARMQKPWSLNRNWRDDRLGDDLAFDLVPS
jgi:hypothetical protein